VEEAVPLRRLGACVIALAMVSTGTVTAHAEPTKDQCINANEGAQSSRAAGKLRDARDQLTVCIARSCPGPVRDDCTERLNEVLKALPTVVFAVRSADGADLSVVRVSMDGALLTARLDGSAIPVDPGNHTFAFEADGFAPVREPLLIREGDKARREAVVLRPAVAIPPPPPPAVVVPAPPATTPVPARPASTTRILSFTALGVGVAGVAVGSIFGAMALGDKSSLDKNCSGNACPASEQSDIHGLHSNGVVSNVGFGVGIVALAAGAALLLFSGGGEPPARSGATTTLPVVGLGAAGVQGTFP